MIGSVKRILKKIKGDLSNQIEVQIYDQPLIEY